MEKPEIRPRHLKTREPVATKIGKGNSLNSLSYPTPVQNCITIRLGDIASRICEVAYQMFTRNFLVLPTRYPQGRSADFDAQYGERRRFAQGCSFFGGSRNKILNLDLIFSKNADFSVR